MEKFSNNSKISNRKIACLTLDLEQDYGDLVNPSTFEGFKNIPQLVELFKEHNIPLTCFVQGYALSTQVKEIELFNEIDVEFELHAYNHPGKKYNVNYELAKGQEIYYKYFGKLAVGYRSPLGMLSDEDYPVLAKNNIKFDSSIFPTFRIGVFNNLNKPILPFKVDGTDIIEIPLTVFSSVVRIPISLSYIKLFGKPYFNLLKTRMLPKFLVLDFHMHDLFKLASYDCIPFSSYPFYYKAIFSNIYNKQADGFGLLKRILKILEYKGYEFYKLIDIYSMLK